MLDQDLKDKICYFLENADFFYGKTIQIYESISTDSLNFNRHFTTSNYSSFLLLKIACRISGARIMFEGQDLYYEIALDLLVSFTENQEKLEFIEKYSEKVYRKTLVKFVA